MIAIPSKKTVILCAAVAAITLPLGAGALAASDTVAPGPDPIEGMAEGTAETGMGVAECGKAVGKGFGKAGGHIAKDTRKHGPVGVVTGSAKGVAEVGKGAAKGAVEIGKGVAEGVGCVVTFGQRC